MEDTLIIPGSFAYHIRIDVLDLSNNRVTECTEAIYNVYKHKLKNFLKDHFTNYYVFLEQGEKTKKIHFQGILWAQYQYTNKYINRLKAKYFLWHRQCKNSLAITNAKKIISLASYISKDKNVQFNNLTDSQREKIPKWKKPNQKQFYKNLDNLIDEYLKNNPTTESSVTKKREIAKQIINYYWQNDKQQPHRGALIKILARYNLYSADEVIENYNLWSHY